MGGRGVIRLKYVHAFRDRMGRMRYYFRRHSKRATLPGLPGSDEFMAAYAAQLREMPKQVEPRPKAAPGTFAALAIRYYGSPQYQSLSTTSRGNYRRVQTGWRRARDSNPRLLCWLDHRRTSHGVPPSRGAICRPDIPLAQFSNS